MMPLALSPHWPATAAASNARRSAQTKAGRWTIFPATSNASIICARNMHARAASAMETTRKWKPQPSRRWQSTRAWPARDCWRTSLRANFQITSLYTFDNNVSEREMKRVVLNRKNILFRWQSTRRQNGGDPGQPDQHLPPARHRPTAVPHAVADEPVASAQKRTGKRASRQMETASGGTHFLAPAIHMELTSF